MINIGVIGHRFLNSRHAIDFVANECFAVLSEAQQNHGQVLALSALAEGADTIFAEAAHALSIPLKVIRPFEYYIDDFPDDAVKNRYRHLQSSAYEEIKLDYKYRCDEAYFQAMHWVLNNADLLVVVWDGTQSSSKAGTSAMVREAAKNNISWIHINVTAGKVIPYLANENYLSPINII